LDFLSENEGFLVLVGPEFVSLLGMMRTFVVLSILSLVLGAHSALSAPQMGALDSSLAVSGVARNVAGNEAQMPLALRQAVAPYLAQGFYVMGWTPARFGGGYYVDLYHSNPAALRSDREDVRTAVKFGKGFVFRPLVQVPLKFEGR
jgi:hypothetical protein